MLKVRLLLVLASALAVPHVFAQTLPPSVVACADETDVLKRLSCYDREVARYRTRGPVAGATAPAPSASTSSGPAASTSAAASPRATGALPADAQRAPGASAAGVPLAPTSGAGAPASADAPGYAASAAVPPSSSRSAHAPAGAPGASGTAVPADLQAEFGMNGELKRKEQGPGAAEPVKLDKLTARITSLSTKAHGESILTLDDGQVWEEAEIESHVPYHVGDEVTIKRGVLGAFYLSTPAVRGMRVKRVR
jgi:hypothetical protein